FDSDSEQCESNQVTILGANTRLNSVFVLNSPAQPPCRPRRDCTLLPPRRSFPALPFVPASCSTLPCPGPAKNRKEVIFGRVSAPFAPSVTGFSAFFRGVFRVFRWKPAEARNFFSAQNGTKKYQKVPNSSIIGCYHPSRDV